MDAQCKQFPVATKMKQSPKKTSVVPRLANSLPLETQRSFDVSLKYGWLYGAVPSIWPRFQTLASQITIDCRANEGTRRRYQKTPIGGHLLNCLKLVQIGIREFKCTKHNYDNQHAQTAKNTTQLVQVTPQNLTIPYSQQHTYIHTYTASHVHHCYTVLRACAHTHTQYIHITTTTTTTQCKLHCAPMCMCRPVNGPVGIEKNTTSASCK